MKLLTPRLKHFDNLQALADYVAQELVNTLEDDLLKMTTSERRQYSNQERADMRRRLHDVKIFHDYAQAVPDLLKASEDFCECIDSTGGLTTDPEGYRVPNADSDWIDLGEAYQHMKRTLRTISAHNPSTAHTHQPSMTRLDITRKDRHTTTVPYRSDLG